jgi:hypothetical protein
MTNSTTPSQDEVLRAKLIGLLGRMITVEEMREKLELPSSTYYDQRDHDRLLNLDNIKALARNLGINPIYLLIECELISAEAGEEFWSLWPQVRGPHPLGMTGVMRRPRNLREARGSRADAPSLG